MTIGSVEGVFLDGALSSAVPLGEFAAFREKERYSNAESVIGAMGWMLGVDLPAQR